MAGYSKAVRSLLVSSLALPGMEELLAGEAPDDSVDYRFTRYDEEPLPANRLAFGDPRRYEIESHQFRIVRNLDDNYSLELDFLHEAMSGSSPWYAVPGPDGPLQVMSGATIRERRNQAQASVGWNGDRNAHRGTLGFSNENDYDALFGIYSGELEREGGLQILAWSASYSDDRISPTDALLFGRVERADRDSFSLSGSFTQVVNRNAVFQAGLSATRQSGFLSDPYKQVWIDRAVVNDSRPDERRSFTASARYRQFMESSEAALVIDYRWFRDDWDIDSHTLEGAWRQPLGEHWLFAPGLRYYSQNAPDFYAPYFLLQPENGLWSSDYRLATFGAISYRMQFVHRRPGWILSLDAEYYDSDESLALSGKPGDAPGLVDFWRLSFGFTLQL